MIWFCLFLSVAAMSMAGIALWRVSRFERPPFYQVPPDIAEDREKKWLIEQSLGDRNIVVPRETENSRVRSAKMRGRRIQ